MIKIIKHGYIPVVLMVLLAACSGNQANDTDGGTDDDGGNGNTEAEVS